MDSEADAGGVSPRAWWARCSAAVARTRGGALIGVASLVAFWVVAALLDPGLVGSRAKWPRPMPAQERAAALDALRAYQQILSDFHASGGGAAMLDAFPATKPMRHRVFREIGFLRDRGIVQVIDLAEAVPISTELTSDDAAEVVLYEEWNWTLRRAADRELLTEVKGFGQGFRYGLRREGAGWLVAWWRAEDVPRPGTAPEFRY